ncbi:sigma-70 family RNA polymerase sigma factor [Cupriavidus necator]|uniref:sigma-70 family RNA polymerase sigma factor n=1 Tax=Cupriavidus necator TaxID=106590 RepID=UPI0027882768|nr:sigma-70 family RNA polymerase sigma factor [Cupriavidus necator]MDQ0140367.1 RNA polymerase sigma-70 factor (ECF subfamily) [Cupriavidus necator]
MKQNSGMSSQADRSQRPGHNAGGKPGFVAATRNAAGPGPLSEPACRPDGTPDWSAMMARAQAGDRAAYRRLLEGIAPYIRALAARQVRNHEDIEDIVQDVLLTVHAVRHTYDPARPFGPWLVSIARRRIIDSLRRRARTRAREAPLDTEPETISDPGANLQEMALDAQAVRDAVDCLPAGQREALRMLKLEEMSLKEAAVASGVSVGALKVATHRALKTLRKLFRSKGSKP